MESFFKGPLNSLLGFIVNNEGVGPIRNFAATRIIASATYISKFKTVQGAWVQYYGSAAAFSTANKPAFFQVRFSGGTVYVNALNSTFGTPTGTATIDVYIKGLYR